MFLRYKFLALIIMASFCLFAQTGVLNAAWWGGDGLPVPPNASEVNRETRDIAGAELNFIYYTSRQEASQIKDFYRTKLSNLGWKEMGVPKDLNQIKLPDQTPALQSEYLSRALETNLIFEKDDDMLIVTFLPGEYSQDAKTKFNVCIAKAIKKAQLSADNIAVPKLVDKPKKNVFPAYPGVSLITLVEKPNSLRATYFSKDDIESVTPFYKTEMSKYGWFLEDEKPIKKMERSDAAGYNSPDSCPTCVKNQPVLSSSMETWFTQLDFSNDRQDRCNILITQVIPMDKLPHSLEITTISVNYEEKTR